MINQKVFFQGLKSLKGSKSPAIPLAACFVALGALLKDAGFNLPQSAASSLFTYALPGQLVMAESLLVGDSIINIFIAVWLVNFILYSMTIALFTLLEHKAQPKWKYYLSSQCNCELFVCCFNLVNIHQILPLYKWFLSMAKPRQVNPK